MTTAELSYLSTVLAAVGWLAALALHAAEWGFARGLAATPATDGSEDTARTRVDLYGRLGVALAVVSACLQVVGVVLRGVAAGRAPWGNMYEFLTASLAFAAVLYLLAVWRSEARWLGPGVALVQTAGLGLAVTVFHVDVAPLMPALHSVWFIGHIVTAALSGAAFNLGGVASAMYLWRRRIDARPGTPSGLAARLPSEARLDLFAYRMHAFAFPLWTFTIAAGAIWAQYAWGRFWNWDPKETWSFVTWIIYAAYLHARATAGWRGVRAAWIALLGLASFWFNFIGVNLLFNGFHAYSGI